MILRMGAGRGEAEHVIVGIAGLESGDQSAGQISSESEDDSSSSGVSRGQGGDSGSRSQEPGTTAGRHAADGIQR